MARFTALAALALVALLAATAPTPAQANFLDRLGDVTDQLSNPLFANLDIAKAVEAAKQAALDAAAKAKAAAVSIYLICGIIPRLLHHISSAAR